MKVKIKKFLKKAILFIANPRLLICFGIAWIITNGWSYIFLAIGTAFEIGWMITVSSAYLAFLWFPFTPEKIITCIISIFLLKAFFPKDEKTLGVMMDLYEKAKNSIKKKKLEKEINSDSIDKNDNTNNKL